MKGIKKLIMAFLVTAMVLGMGITAFAAAGTITVKNAKAGQTYDAYRVFDYVPADENNADAGGVYKLATKFAGLASYTYKEGENSVAMSSFFTVGDNDILDTSNFTTEDQAKTFGKAVLAYAKANRIANDGTTTASADGKATISVDAYGYYVIDSSLGTAVAVDTTTPNVEVAEKNSVPDLDKKVTGATNSATITEDKTGNGAQIGDTVTFTITADLKVGGEGYIITDTVTAGLTLNDVTDDMISFEEGKQALDYTINNDFTKDGKEGFQITFNGEPAEDVTVTVTYTAVVNNDAVVNTAANINEAYLIYGNNTETTHKTTETKTYPLQIKKIAEGDTTEKVLPGAKFEVYRKLDNTKLTFVKVSDTEYKVAKAGTEGAVDTIVTVAETPLTINGLNSETYILKETEAPTGYNLLPATITNGEVSYEHAQEVTVATTSTSEAIQVEKVYDGTGLTLPSTGGIGTTIFYIVGGILIVAGVAYFILRRKADAE